jgi:hypothetical protein
VASGERTVKSGGCPGASGQDANRIAGVSGPGWRAGGATTSPSELKSLTQNPRPKGVGRPCYEAENSACRGEWRRETGSPRRAPNAGPGKRAWRTPIPHLSLSDRKVGQGLIVFPTNPQPSPHPDPFPSHRMGGERGRPAEARDDLAINWLATGSGGKARTIWILNARRRDLCLIKIACPLPPLLAT